MKHKSDDYKISAVKYYLKNKDNIRKTCRDRNGSSNIYKRARNAINNIDRPSYLCREISNQSTSTSAYNQTL